MTMLAARSAAARARLDQAGGAGAAKLAEIEQRIATIERRLGIAASAPSGDPDATR
jgi:hypothetical protein